MRRHREAFTFLHLPAARRGGSPKSALHAITHHRLHSQLSPRGRQAPWGSVLVLHELSALSVLGECPRLLAARDGLICGL